MKALICGISGQDGAYLARLLLDKGYQVYGTSRDAPGGSFANLVALGIRDRVTLLSMTANDFGSTMQALAQVKPDEIYNLSGPSSVALSFQQPLETMESSAVGTLNLLECIRIIELPTKLYHAGSSECYGNTHGQPASESTPFQPRSPYAVAKAAACWAVANYREAYQLFACNGILFNHESPLRPERFVTRKIVAAASRIAAGSTEKLRLGDISVVRDWGWAPEYVEAMWLMLQQPKPEDFVIATGNSHSLEAFLEVAFAEAGLQWRDHVETDPAFLRPTELAVSRADPAKAARLLGWSARYAMPDVAAMMVRAEAETLGLKFAGRRVRPAN